MHTGILMLAAGFSRRFGADKRIATLSTGATLLETSAARALDSGLPLVVCLRPGDDELAARLRALGAGVTFCAAAAAGMGSTLAEAMRGVSGWDAVLIALGDMPEIEPRTYRRVAAALEAASICRPVYAGTPGHPVGFGSNWFPALRRLAGDRGARDIVSEHRDRVLDVEVDDPGILRDVDSLQDLR